MKLENILCIAILILSYKSVMANSNLKVLVSIKPLHSLVSAVMDGVAEPELLMKGNDSPHSYSLRPSSVKIMQESDILFWGGRTLEVFLEKSIKVLMKKAKIVSLLEIEGLTVLKLRDKKKLMTEGFLTANEHSNGMKNYNIGIDPHIWLDPLNAKKILDKIVNNLSEIDPYNDEIYIKNGQKYKIFIDELDRKISLKMVEISNSPFLVLHDAYQYFESHYKLKNIGSFELMASFGISVRRMKEIRAIIKKEKILCVFGETNMSIKLLKTAVEGTNTKIEILDPLGINIKKGPNLYLDLLNNLGNKFVKCLNGNY